MIGKSASELIFESPKQWIVGEPLRLQQIAGKVVLLEFWAYSCINCLRVLPALAALWQTYGHKRFMLIGIHTPEFAFEQEVGNAKYAVKKYSIDYPILHDPSRINWENYGNKYWPRSALIDGEGKIIFEHYGEYGYSDIEEHLITALAAMRDISSDVPRVLQSLPSPKPGVSREMYLGSVRSREIPGYFCSKEGCSEYHDNGRYKMDELHVHGDWMHTREYLEYKGVRGKGWMVHKYCAQEVNVVMSGIGRVEVLLDDKSLRLDQAGADVKFEKEKSYVSVEGADLYNIIRSSFVHGGIVKLMPFEELKIYSLTFA